VTTTVTLSNNGSATVTFTPVVVVNGVTTTLASGDAGARAEHAERTDHGAADDHRSDGDGQRERPQRARQQPGTTTPARSWRVRCLRT
jgi:hypothetical protein